MRGVIGTRHLNDWELDNVEFFISRLLGKVVNREEDRVVWMDARINKFSMKSLYVVLESRRSIPCLVRVILNPWVPSKASFFVWEACWGKVLTLD